MSDPYAWHSPAEMIQREHDQLLRPPMGVYVHTWPEGVNLGPGHITYVDDVDEAAAVQRLADASQQWADAMILEYAREAREASERELRLGWLGRFWRDLGALLFGWLGQ